MKERKQARQMLLHWYEQMTLCFERELSTEERADLEKWDREWVDGGAGISTSDWPGWEKHIGKRPNMKLVHFEGSRRRSA